MPEKALYEYSVIRVMPRVDRGELLNVGVIVYCAAHKYLKMMSAVDTSRLSALAVDFSVAELKDHLEAANRICNGGKEGGAIGELSLGERFRWLTAPRSTILQMSPAHSGLTADADKTLADLVEKLVN